MAPLVAAFLVIMAEVIARSRRGVRSVALIFQRITHEDESANFCISAVLWDTPPMSEVNAENFAALVNAELDAVDPKRNMRRFTAEEGRQAWEGKPAELLPDDAVRTYVHNVIEAYRQMPDNGSD